MNGQSQEAKGVLLDNPDLFVSHYFKEALTGTLKPFHLRLIDTATSKNPALVLYPAGHGKTTLVSTILPIWALCRDPNIRISIIAKNHQEASKISLALKGYLVANEELIRDFGPFRPETDDKPWSAGQMTVAKRTLVGAKEPTLSFFGSGSKDTLGTRANWVICDDVVTEKNSDTPEQREKLREWFNQSIDTMNLPGGRLTVVGTLFDPSDLYNDLIDMCDPETGEPIWHIQREDAIVDMCVCAHPIRSHRDEEFECKECGCQEAFLDDNARVPLWPEWWPWPALMRKKATMGTLDFNKRYRNIAVDKSRMVFKEEYVRGGWIGGQKYDGCVDEGYQVGDFDPAWRRVSGFDPAIGVTKSAKFCAHVILGMGSCAKHERCIWVIDVLRDQLSLPQQVDTILERHQRYDLHRSVVEANSYQAGLFDALKRRMDEAGLAFDIQPHYTTRTNKPDPELGVQAMSPWFENGWVHIPQGTPESRRKMKQLIDELIQYPGRYSDTVMAFWFAWKQLQETGPKYKSSNYLKKPMAWGTRSGRRIQHNPYYERSEA
jgi:predicted phage terminase large subunit-like protein